MATKRVYKYRVVEDDETAIEMPAGALVLTVQTQHDVPHIWALVDPSAPTELRKFRLAGTGHAIDDAAALKYIGTYQAHGGRLVFHLFESRR